jgi:hypothetical protein
VIWFVRRTWLVAAVTVVACAAFSARAAWALVEASYLAPAPPAAAALPLAANRAEPTPKRDAGPLAARNIFCSTCGPVAGPGPTDTFSPDAILIATSIGIDPRATVRVPASEVQGSWGVGDRVPGLGTIENIGWVSIDIVDSTGRHGHLRLAGAATPVKPESAGSAAAADSAWADRIKKIDDHTYEVDRTLVRDLVGGGVKTGGVRVIPMTEHGEMTGLRLFGAGTGSLPAALGLQNGDVLKSLNNTEIKSANVLIGLYGQLDTLNVVELDGTRGSKPLALTLRLR